VTGALRTRAILPYRIWESVVSDVTPRRAEFVKLVSRQMLCGLARHCPAVYGESVVSNVTPRRAEFAKLVSQQACDILIQLPRTSRGFLIENLESRCATYES